MTPEKLDYAAMIARMEEVLAPFDDATKLGTRFPFRSRVRHTRRVAAWAARLLREDGAALDEEGAATLMTAAVFHDAGYALEGDAPHAEKGANWFRAHAAEFGYAGAAAERVAFLIERHSDKALFGQPDTPLDLILLMEADSLDELGAMGILWDAMAEGASVEQSYERSLERIRTHVERLADKAGLFPTAGAQSAYTEKRGLAEAFTAQLERDLALWMGETWRKDGE